MLLADPSSAVDPFEERGRDESSSTASPPVKGELEFAEFESLSNDLVALLHPQPDDDDEAVSPTMFAFGNGFLLLGKTREVMRRNYVRSQDPNWRFPRGYVSTDDLGGLRFEWWHNRTHCVTLVVGHDENAPSYVFVKWGPNDKGTVHRRVFHAWLASQLHTLNEVKSTQG